MITDALAAAVEERLAKEVEELTDEQRKIIRDASISVGASRVTEDVDCALFKEGQPWLSVMLAKLPDSNYFAFEVVNFLESREREGVAVDFGIIKMGVRRPGKMVGKRVYRETNTEDVKLKSLRQFLKDCVAQHEKEERYAGSDFLRALRDSLERRVAVMTAIPRHAISVSPPSPLPDKIETKTFEWLHPDNVGNVHCFDLNSPPGVFELLIKDHKACIDMFNNETMYLLDTQFDDESLIGVVQGVSRACGGFMSAPERALIRVSNELPVKLAEGKSYALAKVKEMVTAIKLSRPRESCGVMPQWGAF